MTMTDLPPVPCTQRVPKPLTPEQQAAVDKRNEEIAAKRRAEVAEKATGLLAKFGPRHADRPVKEKKAVQAFDPFAPREVKGDVNWEAQAKAKDQQRTAGKRKNVSGEKKGK